MHALRRANAHFMGASQEWLASLEEVATFGDVPLGRAWGYLAMLLLNSPLKNFISGRMSGFDPVIASLPLDVDVPAQPPAASPKQTTEIAQHEPAQGPQVRVIGWLGSYEMRSIWPADTFNPPENIQRLLDAKALEYVIEGAT